MGTFEVLDAGGLTTVQDLGRYGFQRYGVPVSGAMDAFALRVANLLVGNGEGDAGLEMTLAGPQLLCLANTVVAVTGGDLQPRLDDGAAPMWEAFPVAAGSVLSFRGRRTGARGYLGVAGGLDVPVVLGSRSTYLRSRFGGIEGRALRPGDLLPAGQASGPVDVRRLPHGFLPTYIGSHTVRAVLGPQASAFTKRGVQTLLGSAYTIAAESDRMGYRLEGPAIERCAPADIISDGTPAGAVQVPGSGVPIILLADRGTAGGYTKIAAVISADLPRLAQSGPGDRVFFQAVTVEEAHAALRREAAFFEELRHAPTINGVGSN
jgi:antagonist of KipI